jgi:hypothetical protein
MTKTLGEMTPEERSAAIGRATDKFQAELDASAPAIGAALDSVESPAPAWQQIEPGRWVGPYDTLITMQGRDGEYWGYGPAGSNFSGRKIVRIARSLATVKAALEVQAPALEALVKLRATLEAKHPEDRDVWGPYVYAVERAL